MRTRMLAATLGQDRQRAAGRSNLLAPALSRLERSVHLAYRGRGRAAAGNAQAAAEILRACGALDAGNVVDQGTARADPHVPTGETDRAFRDLEAMSKTDAGEAQADLALVAGYLRQRKFDQALAVGATIVRK